MTNLRTEASKKWISSSFLEVYCLAMNNKYNQNEIILKQSCKIAYVNTCLSVKAELCPLLVGDPDELSSFLVILPAILPAPHPLGMSLPLRFGVRDCLPSSPLLGAREQHCKTSGDEAWAPVNCLHLKHVPWTSFLSPFWIRKDNLAVRFEVNDELHESARRSRVFFTF